MFVRLTFCKFMPEKINEARKIFTEEILAGGRKQKGLIDVRFLYPRGNIYYLTCIRDSKTKEDGDV